MKTDFQLSLETLTAEPAEHFLRSKKSGGEVVFVGVIRDTHQNHSVLFIDYEAYEAMAKKEFELLAQLIHEKWQAEAVVLHHRKGRVFPGEIAVVAGVATAHRKAAFEACAFLMDELKVRIPIWKNEVFSEQ